MVDRDAVKADPLAQTNANGCDLVFACGAGWPQWLFRALHPNADAAFASFPGHIKAGQRGNDPVFELGNKTAYIAPTCGDIEHHVSDPLTGPVIGILPAPCRDMDWKAVWLHKIFGLGGGAGGIERRVFYEPDTFRGRPSPNIGYALLHKRHGLSIVGQAFGDDPFNHANYRGSSPASFNAGM